MTWFKDVFGFEEGSYGHTQAQFDLEGDQLRSRANQRSYSVGRFSTPSIAQLREAVAFDKGPSVLEHVVIDDVLEIQGSPKHAGDTFMVASQFNCLEFPVPHAIPEDGITGYANDRTQGPACAIGAAPATVYRNYFAPVDNAIGQTADRQINNLSALEKLLGDKPYWQVSNGYVDSRHDALDALDRRLQEFNQDVLTGALKIGYQRQCDVVFSHRYWLLDAPHPITQTFCSAMSIGYSAIPAPNWEGIARVVLDGAYEGTLLAAAHDRDLGTGSGRVWLTFLGGGVFQNPKSWIRAAIQRALVRADGLGLQINLAHFRQIDNSYTDLNDHS